MPLSIPVKDLMTSTVETTTTDAPVDQVASRLRDDDLGALVVTEDDDVVGIVTMTDLIGLLADGLDASDHTVADVMSSPVQTVSPVDTVHDAVRLMHDEGYRKLPVVDGTTLVGIITDADITRYLPQVVNRHLHAVPDAAADDRERRQSVRPEMEYERSGWSFESECVSTGCASLGDRVVFSKVLGDEDVKRFAEASGDTNRLHLDDDFAAKTRFGHRIAHGTLVAGVISAALARLPGLTIYISQDLSFLGPVDIGERVRAECIVVEDLGGNRYQLTTDVYGEDDELVVEGEAVVIVDEVEDRAVEVVAED